MLLVINGSKPDYMGGYDWTSQQNTQIMDKIRSVIEKKLNTGETIDFMFNGQLGTPQMACDLVIRLKKIGAYNNIGKITIVLACESMTGKWYSSSLKIHKRHLEEADEVIYLDTLEEYQIPEVEVGEYHYKKFKNVYSYMVNKADGIIVVSDTKDMDTEKFISFATNNGKSVARIDTKTCKITALFAKTEEEDKQQKLREAELNELKKKQEYLDKYKTYKKAILDTETNDIIRGRKNIKYPDIVQLSYLLLDEYNNIECAKNFYFTVDYMSEGAEKVHGLSLDKLRLLSNGKVFEDCKEEIIKDLLGREIICHNTKFDVPVMNNSLVDTVIGDKSMCTMEWYKYVVKLPSEYYHYKQPKLEEVIAYFNIDNGKLLKMAQELYNCDEIGYHDSRYDIIATYEIYRRIGETVQ